MLKHGIARPCKHACDSVALGDKPDASKCRLTPEHRYSFLDDSFRSYAFIGRRASSDGRMRLLRLATALDGSYPGFVNYIAAAAERAGMSER